MFCKNCGKEINDKAIVCVGCGCATNVNNQSEKSWVATLLLCVFLGSFGAHRFYVGKIGTGIAMFLIMLLLGWLGIGLLICGIWSLIDLIMICIGSFKTKEGLDLKK